jgi:prepilin-type N-terminal cleavage/methylation domain-containing protein
VKESRGPWRRLLARIRTDAGLTLMELLVGMAIMAIFMGMFTGAVVMMYGSTSKAEAIGDSASQLSIAFSRLDTSVRYATLITEPTPNPAADGSWYVEWLGIDRSGNQQCTQLAIGQGGGTLWQRTRPFGNSWGGTGWTAIASNLVLTDPISGAAVTPFVVDWSTSLQSYQTLTLHFISKATGRDGDTYSHSDVTFTAFNSSASPPAGGDDCTG